MKIKTENWTVEQYKALAAALIPGVTLNSLVAATNSTAAGVIYRLRGLHLISAVDTSEVVENSTGWRWIRSSRRDKLAVVDGDNNLIVDMFPLLENVGYKLDDHGLVRSPLHSFLRVLNHLVTDRVIVSSPDYVEPEQPDVQVDGDDSE